MFLENQVTVDVQNVKVNAIVINWYCRKTIRGLAVHIYNKNTDIHTVAFIGIVHRQQLFHILLSNKIINNLIDAVKYILYFQTRNVFTYFIYKERIVCLLLALLLVCAALARMQRESE